MNSSETMETSRNSCKISKPRRVIHLHLKDFSSFKYLLHQQPQINSLLLDFFRPYQSRASMVLVRGSHPLAIGNFLSNCLPHQIFQVMTEWRSSLIGRICFEDTICSNAYLFKAFKELWHVHQKLYITECGRNKFIFKFRYQFDLLRVLNGGPWSVCGFLVILKPWNPFEHPLEVVLAREAFWVRLLNLPTVHLNEESIWSIASNVGQILFIDPVCSDGIRVRVLVDADSQLKRGANTPIIGGVRNWVQFRYENLPFQFCDICYHLGHLMTACPTIDYTMLEELHVNELMEGEDAPNYLDHVVLQNLNINEELINPYGDEESEKSLSTLDIILNSSHKKSSSQGNFIEVDFLPSDLTRFQTNTTVDLNIVNPIPIEELQRYRNGKRTRIEDVGSSSNMTTAMITTQLTIKQEPLSPKIEHQPLELNDYCESNLITTASNNLGFGDALMASSSKRDFVNHWMDVAKVLVYDNEMSIPTEEQKNLPPTQVLLDKKEIRGEHIEYILSNKYPEETPISLLLEEENPGSLPFFQTENGRELELSLLNTSKELS